MRGRRRREDESEEGMKARKDVVFMFFVQFFFPDLRKYYLLTSSMT